MDKGMRAANKSILATLFNEPFTFLGGLLLFLMAFSPAYNVLFKVILIGIMLVTIIVSQFFFNRLNITKPVFAWYSLLVFHGLFFSIIGFVYGNNTDFVLRSTTYNIIWPVVYFIFTVGIYKKTSLEFLVKVIVIAHFCISLYLIGSFLTLLHILPKLPVLTFDMSFLALDQLGGLIKVQAPSVTTLLYTIPFVISLSLLGGEHRLGFRRWFIYLSILLSIFAVLATARRALILNIFLGLGLTYILIWLAPALDKKAFNKRVLKVLLVGIALLTILIIFLDSTGFFNFSLITDKFSSAFSGREDLNDESTNLRYEQLTFLLKSWSQKPWFGFGHGAVSTYTIRSEKTPWIYELSYVALLFQTGIVGLSIYLLLLVWPIYKGILIIRKADRETCFIIIPSLVGCVSFLIANASNPYLQAYDCMWALFLPVAIINHYLKKHE